jgi:hypothetical protein
MMETNFESRRRFNDNNKEGKGETEKGLLTLLE